MAVPRRCFPSAWHVSATRPSSAPRKLPATFKALLVSKSRHATLRHARRPSSLHPRRSQDDQAAARYELKKQHRRSSRIDCQRHPASPACNLALRYAIRADSARGISRKTLAIGTTLTTGKAAPPRLVSGPPRRVPAAQCATKKRRGASFRWDGSGPGERSLRVSWQVLRSMPNEGSLRVKVRIHHGDTETRSGTRSERTS